MTQRLSRSGYGRYSRDTTCGSLHPWIFIWLLQLHSIHTYLSCFKQNTCYRKVRFGNVCVGQERLSYTPTTNLSQPNPSWGHFTTVNYCQLYLVYCRPNSDMLPILVQPIQCLNLLHWLFAWCCPWQHKSRLTINHCLSTPWPQIPRLTVLASDGFVALPQALTLQSK